MARVRAGHHDKLWTPHLRYTAAIERALTLHKNRDLSEAHQNVFDAYKNTPTPQTLTVISSLWDPRLEGIEKVPARTDGRPTVGLVLIAVGNEVATVLARAIISAIKIVDAVTVVADGGEESMRVARHIGADVHIRPTPKIDWDTGIGAIAGARNEALAIAERKTDYVLMLDADDSLAGDLPQRLDHDIYELEIHDSNIVYRRNQMWRSACRFRYEGIIHETLTCRGSVGKVPGLKYLRRFGGGHQDSVPAAVKYMRHAKLAMKWLIDHPDDSRTQFYLAQSYRDAGKDHWDEAAAAYEKRIGMTTGNDEERGFSAFQIAKMIRERGGDPTAA